MKRHFRKVILTGITVAAMCIGVFASKEDAAAGEIWIVDGCTFDDAAGTLTITSDFDWEWIPWMDGDMDRNTIVTANIDTTGLNVYDSVYENYESWKYLGFAEMFSDCINLQSVRFSGEISSKGELNLYGMFSFCEKLKTVDLRGFAGAKITNMAQMFEGCHNLESIDLRGVNTSNTLSMNNLFY